LIIIFPGYRNRSEEPLSLKDFLAETGRRRTDAQEETLSSIGSSSDSSSTALFSLSKCQQKALHEALYYAAETAHLDIAIDLRNLGM
jgi:hypothetical protein